MIALATCRELPSLDPDEASLAAAFARRGLAAAPVVWDVPSIDWRKFEAVILRNTWDYHENIGQFRQWLARLQGEGVRVWKPPTQVLANLHKGYLRDLESRGIPIVPTHWINPRGGDRDLAGILERNGWDDVVLKPAVSAGSRNTYRFRRAEAAAQRKNLDAILEEDT